MSKPAYDTTLARMAGNIAAGWVNHDQLICRVVEGRLHRQMLPEVVSELAEAAVQLARAIVAEVKKTEIVNENGTLSPAGDANALDVNRTAEALGRTRLDVER